MKCENIKKQTKKGLEEQLPKGTKISTKFF